MRRTANDRGFTMVELMIAMAIFAIVMSAVYSVYISILKNVVTQRNVAKTELDVVSVAWPLAKEISAAGYGVPPTTTALSYASGVLTIRSTVAGDDVNVGKWSLVGTSCAVTGIPDGASVVVLNAGNKNYLGAGTVGSGLVSPCSSDYYSTFSSIVFWSPISTGIQSYETKYALTSYASGARPAWCEANTQQLSRSVATTTTASYQPMLDCVYNNSLNFRFGCIDTTNGDLTWQTGSDCTSASPNAKLRFVRFGLLIQSSGLRDLQSQATITLFEDLALTVPITLTTDQRNYKWKKVEQTVALRNLE